MSSRNKGDREQEPTLLDLRQSVEGSSLTIVSISVFRIFCKNYSVKNVNNNINNERTSITIL